MTTFQRKLGIDKYSAEQIAATPWLVEMLRHWRPAGHAVPMQHWEPPLIPAGGAPIQKKPKMKAGPRPFGLRLAIRKNSANFYCGGQSIAKFSATRKLQGKIHKEYTTDVQFVGQEYVHLSDVEPQIEAWMTRIHRHQGGEKLLVDELWSANGG